MNTNLFIHHSKFQYWSEKNNIDPSNILNGSNKKYLFNCPCGHEFEISPNKISSGNWCPYCCKPSKKLCNKDDCKKCFEKSFASHEKSKYWSIKNGDIKPRYVNKGSDKKYWFKCECEHEFEQSLDKITGKNMNRWCAYCTNQKLCDDDNCKKCFDKSFASHAKANQWNYEKNIGFKPRNIFTYSDKEYWFICDCKHEFKKSIKNVSISEKCEYCSGQKLCQDNECDDCFNKSFASHSMLKFWINKDNINPRNIFKCSDTKCWFKCENNHEFDISLSNLANNRWCPICKNKCEQKLFDKLKDKFPNIQAQFRADWCKNDLTNKHLPFDFVIVEHNIIIELDGRQHFEQVSNWTSPEEQFKRDTYKMECANKNNYSVIRIYQKDVWDDSFDWYSKLIECIDTNIKNKEIKNYFISSNNKYLKFN
jgi:very-short-patch-repair endonuclease